MARNTLVMIEGVVVSAVQACLELKAYFLFTVDSDDILNEVLDQALCYLFCVVDN